MIFLLGSSLRKLSKQALIKKPSKQALTFLNVYIQMHNVYLHLYYMPEYF